MTARSRLLSPGMSLAVLSLVLALGLCWSQPGALAQTVGFEVETASDMYVLHKDGADKLDPYRGYDGSLNKRKKAAGVGTEDTPMRAFVAKTLAKPVGAPLTWKVGADSYNGFADLELRTTPMALNDYVTIRNTNGADKDKNRLAIFKPYLDWFTSIHQLATAYHGADATAKVANNGGTDSHTVFPIITAGGDKLGDAQGDPNGPESFTVYKFYHIKNAPDVTSPQITFSLKIDKVSEFISKIGKNSPSFQWTWGPTETNSALIKAHAGNSATYTRYNADVEFKGFVQFLALYAGDALKKVADGGAFNQQSKSVHALYLRGNLNAYYKLLTNNDPDTDYNNVKSIIQAIYNADGTANKNTFIDQLVKYAVKEDGTGNHLSGYITTHTDDTIQSKVAKTIYIELRTLSVQMNDNIMLKARTHEDSTFMLWQVTDWLATFHYPPNNFREVFPDADSNADSNADSSKTTRTPAWLKKFNKRPSDN